MQILKTSGLRYDTEQKSLGERDAFCRGFCIFLIFLIYVDVVWLEALTGI